jgi:hypothetical protein
MNYVKPQLVFLADAQVAIQSSDGDKTGGNHESLTTETAAYEADE